MTTLQLITQHLTQNGLTTTNPIHENTHSTTIKHNNLSTHDLWINNNTIILLSFIPEQDHPYGTTTHYPLEDPNTLDKLLNQIKQNHKKHTNHTTLNPQAGGNP